MQTYDDIQTIDRREIGTQADCERISALDIREEAEQFVANGSGRLQYLRAGAFNEESVEVLYFSTTGRAGVAAGGQAVWTDAASADDALRRFFGANGLEMVE